MPIYGDVRAIESNDIYVYFRYSWKDVVHRGCQGNYQNTFGSLCLSIVF